MKTAAALALPFVVVACIALITGWPLPHLSLAETFPMTPLGLLGGGYERLAGAATSCELGNLRPLAAAGYVAVFFATAAIESPFYAFALRRISRRRRAATLLWANLATHPVVFFALPCFFREYRPFILTAELFAPAAEALIVAVVLRDQSPAERRRAMLLVVLANLVSWQFGGVVYAW